MGSLGFNYKKDAPRFTHDCTQCKFLMTITMFRHPDEGEETIHLADVYEQCGETGRYLIRFSSEGSDYASGITLETLLSSYVTVSTGVLHGLHNFTKGGDVA